MIKIMNMLLVLGLLVTIVAAETYYILPAENASCPTETIPSHNVSFPATPTDHTPLHEEVTCLTLNQYINLKPVSSSAENITLLFAPGNHMLDSRLQIQNSPNLVLQVADPTNSSANSLSIATVTCTNDTGFDLEDITVVSICGLVFLYCQENSVRAVDQLMVDNCKLQHGSGIDLVDVVNATIIGSSFVGLKAFETILNFFSSYTVEAGGAIIAFNSNVLISGCQFEQNKAGIGGAIHVVHGSIFIQHSTFRNNTANFAFGGRGGGGAIMSDRCTVKILGCDFTNNTAALIGGAILADSVSISIRSSNFISNTARRDGALSGENGDISIQDSYFVSNTARSGSGAVGAGTNSVLSIHGSSFRNNTSLSGDCGGAIHAYFRNNVDIHGCNFSFNSAANYGGAITVSRGNIVIGDSVFTSNRAGDNGGAIRLCFDSVLSINESDFIANTAVFGGAISGCISASIHSSNFNSNGADSNGGAIYVVGCTMNIHGSNFYGNRAGHDGGALYGSGPSSVFTGFGKFISIHDSNFTSNTAGSDGGAFLHIGYSPVVVTMNNSIFNQNQASNQGGAIHILRTFLDFSGSVMVVNNSAKTGAVFSLHSVLTLSGNTTFSHNKASLYVFASNITFTGFSNFVENVHMHDIRLSVEEGGALTFFQSENVVFSGVMNFFYNQVYNGSGGAILLSESRILIFGDTHISNNTALSGGGIYSYQSEITFAGRTSIANNVAEVRGGGIRAIGTTLQLTRNTLEPTHLQFTENQAMEGGGIYMELNSKLYVIKLFAECTLTTTTIGCFIPPTTSLRLSITFKRNLADYGGALYVSDETCSANADQSTSSECFLQDLALHDFTSPFLILRVIFFTNNSANIAGRTIYGGLLDRCTVSPYAQVYNKYQNASLGLDTMSYLTNITDLQTYDIIQSEISSQPVRVCFCIHDQPDCDSSLPPMYAVRKGETFKVSLVAVDHVRNPILNSSVRAFLSSNLGGLAEGEDIQDTSSNCTELSFTITSPRNLEQLWLYAEGSCNDIGISRTHLNVDFLPCTCPIGFVPIEQQSNCTCECDPCLFPNYITGCSPHNSSVQRRDDVWISYINTTHEDYGSGGNQNEPQCPFLNYAYCPFDYCHPSVDPVWINLNKPTGSDAQCAFNRIGKLCGSCEDGLSLSFGSSRCMQCPNYWLALLIVFAIAGVALVTFLLVFNLTVAVGTINGLIFYANILKTSRATFFPFQTPNFITIFISWLNLDFGFVTCFFDGMDGYAKEWLQLVFPIYIIFLVALVIIACEYTTRIARLFTHTNPVATLSTLILLSYAKSLRVIIAAMSSATLQYPDGSRESVWLTDANIHYFKGKHIPLFLVALLILLVGIAYTSLLFSYQWLLRCPNRRALKWIKNARFYPFMDAYLAPYNLKHRYWTGLLLLIRAFLYVVAALNVSGDPGNNLLSIIITLVCLLLLKESLFGRVYKSWLLNALEDSFIINLILFSVGSLYIREAGTGNQEKLAFASASIAFITFLAILIYHTYAFVLSKKARNKLNSFKFKIKHFFTKKEENVNHEIIVIPNAVCTYSVVDGIPHPHEMVVKNTVAVTKPEATSDSVNQSIPASLRTIDKNTPTSEQIAKSAQKELNEVDQYRMNTDEQTELLSKPRASTFLANIHDPCSGPDSDEWGIERETELQDFVEVTQNQSQ